MTPDLQMDSMIANALCPNADDSELATAIASLSESVRNGHACFNLDEGLARQFRHHPLAGDQLNAPLVVDDQHRLYFAKHWRAEQQVAAEVADRIKGRVERNEQARRVLDAMSRSAVTDEQRAAAAGVFDHRFAIIKGGPGTGKTSTIALCVALLIAHAKKTKTTVPRVLLMAPTGKAAARLGQALQEASDRLELDESLIAHMPTEAQTIHRHLRASDEADLVVIDEASMVDLTLMRDVLRKYRHAKRLVLVGDVDQLASVQAGSILDDLSSEAEMGVPVFELSHAHRFAQQDDIAALTQAIVQRDEQRVVSIIDKSDSVSLEADARPALIQAAQKWQGVVTQTDPNEQLCARREFQLLCAPRGGPDGVDTISNAIEAHLVRSGAIGLERPHYSGRPFLITRNDAALDLYNGDIGVIARVGQNGALVAHLESGRQISPLRLPPHETSYAMSVHKSQGSEYDEVCVVLPRKPSPMLFQQLLYTAVSRAKRGVKIIGAKSDLMHAINTRATRASGLRQAVKDALQGA